VSGAHTRITSWLAGRSSGKIISAWRMQAMISPEAERFEHFNEWVRDTDDDPVPKEPECDIMLVSWTEDWKIIYRMRRTKIAKSERGFVSCSGVYSTLGDFIRLFLTEVI
jgi:hypothetical protein